MTDSASLKIDRATKHVSELNELFRKNRAFVYVVKTDTKTGERSFVIKTNEPIVNEAALICGDVVHNLRSALDHTYWEIISPHCTSDQERWNVQFPFTSKADELCKTLHAAYAQRAGTGFYCAMRNLRPHGESGGNEMISLIREAYNLDKHRLLIPAVDYTKIVTPALNVAIPDFPLKIRQGGQVNLVGFAQSTIKWMNKSVPSNQLGRIVPSTLSLFEREIDLPIEIIFQLGKLGRVYPMVPTLNQMTDSVRQTVAIMREAAASY